MRTTASTRRLAGAAAAATATFCVGLAGWHRHRCGVLQRELADARRAATHDPLTGLVNRAGLVAAWPGLARRQPAVAVLDLDGFKRVNDAHGHAAGDELLVTVASRLQRAVPGMVARLGGDEFAAVIVGPDPAPVARRLAAVVAAPVRVSAVAAVQVTTSVGLTQAGTDLSAALGEADAAMYGAKTTGIGVAVYDPRRDDRPTQASDPRPVTRVRDRHGQQFVPAVRLEWARAA